MTRINTKTSIGRHLCTPSPGKHTHSEPPRYNGSGHRHAHTRTQNNSILDRPSLWAADYDSSVLGST